MCPPLQCKHSVRRGLGVYRVGCRGLKVQWLGFRVCGFRGFGVTSCDIMIMVPYISC